jgi:hypothetical protein
VKVVQQMLGHSSAAMTMGVYGHLFSDRLDEVANALDTARSEAARSAAAVANAQNPVAKVLPNADVVDLAAYKSKGKTAGQAPNSDGAPGEIRTRAPASGGRLLPAAYGLVNRSCWIAMPRVAHVFGVAACLDKGVSGQTGRLLGLFSGRRRVVIPSRRDVAVRTLTWWWLRHDLWGLSGRARSDAAGRPSRLPYVVLVVSAVVAVGVALVLLSWSGALGSEELLGPCVAVRVGPPAARVVHDLAAAVTVGLLVVCAWCLARIGTSGKS